MGQKIDEAIFIQEIQEALTKQKNLTQIEEIINQKLPVTQGTTIAIQKKAAMMNLVMAASKNGGAQVQTKLVSDIVAIVDGTLPFTQPLSAVVNTER